MSSFEKLTLIFPKTFSPRCGSNKSHKLPLIIHFCFFGCFMKILCLFYIFSKSLFKSLNFSLKRKVLESDKKIFYGNEIEFAPTELQGLPNKTSLRFSFNFSRKQFLKKTFLSLNFQF